MCALECPSPWCRRASLQVVVQGQSQVARSCIAPDSHGCIGSAVAVSHSAVPAQLCYTSALLPSLDHGDDPAWLLDDGDAGERRLQLHGHGAIDNQILPSPAGKY